jgi:hypothetical protein
MSPRRQPRRGPLASRPITPVLAAARHEAELARHGYFGVEHLLLALTRSDAGDAARLLAEHTVTQPRARDAVWLVVGSGRGDGPRFDPARLLGTLGIDLDQIRRQVQRQFGPDAIHHLYTSPVGWNLRPRGPLCDLPPSTNLKKAVFNALGRCWDTAPPQMNERLLLGALDTNSPALIATLGELDVSLPHLREAIGAQIRLAS